MPSRRARRPLSRAFAANETEDQVAVPVTLNMSPAAAERLRAYLRRGNSRFVVSSTDGALSVRISMVSARPTLTEETVVGLGNAIIDWDRGLVERDNRKMKLSRTELRIFACLLEHAGEAVPHDQLIASAWTSTADDAGYNALAVYVCYLRRNLKKIGLGSALRTVRNVGYLLAVEAPRENAPTGSGTTRGRSVSADAAASG